jgi:peptidoglycan/xylan/chitin deacetylase (PgdA/CDA1 family)
MAAFAWPGGARAAVSLTFDDARLSQADVALPILDKYGIRATFYVSPKGLDERIETWRRAAAAGHEIGNHTATHPCSGNFPWSRANALEDYTLERMEADIDAASAHVEKALGVSPVTFAYPCGQKFVGRGPTRRSYAPLVARKFIAARSAFDEVPNDPSFCDLAALAGIDADGASPERLEAMAEGALAQGAWLVLFAHEVGAARRQTLAAEDLDGFCRYLTSREGRIWVGTVAEGASCIIGQREA